jgi:hypothetical protein
MTARRTMMRGGRAGMRALLLVAAGTAQLPFSTSLDNGVAALPRMGWS